MSESQPHLDLDTMTITHVIAGLNMSGGGPSYSVPRLTEAIRQLGPHVLVRTLSPPAGETIIEAAKSEHYRVHARIDGILSHALGRSRSMRQALKADGQDRDVIHVHGLWQLPNVYGAHDATQTAKRILSPRGMLSPPAMTFSKRKKALFWNLWQKQAVQACTCLHATAESELAEIRDLGIDRPIAVIPNGIDVPVTCIANREPTPGQRTVLSLGRVHPKKGLDRLLQAWALVECKYPDWKLRIVGPPENDHDIELRKLAKRLGTRSVSIEGAIYGEAISDAFLNAGLFVLPTLSENFAITVAEALAAEVPVISTVGAPWEGLRTNACGWWIDHGIEPMADTLAEAMNLPASELKAMGKRGREWMASSFAWEHIGKKMLCVYNWMCERDDPPDFLQFR